MFALVQQQIACIGSTAIVCASGVAQQFELFHAQKPLRRCQGTLMSSKVVDTFLRVVKRRKGGAALTGSVDELPCCKLDDAYDGHPGREAFTDHKEFAAWPAWSWDIVLDEGSCKGQVHLRIGLALSD